MVWGHKCDLRIAAAGAALWGITAATIAVGQVGTVGQAGAAGDSRGVIVLRGTQAQPAMAPVATPAVPALTTPTTITAQPLASPALSTAANPVAPVPGRPTAPSPLLKACSRPFDHSVASVGRTAGFNRTLAAALRRKPASAVVDLPQPFKVGDDAPATLAPWLTQVKASGGIVSATEYCRESRGMFSFLGRMFGGAKQSAFKAADGYDAVLHVDGLDQKVTQIEFKRRAL